MGKLSFWESVRVWLGGIAFDVFLWSARMSADDYFDMIQTEGGLTPRAADAPEASANWCNPVNGVHAPFCNGDHSARR